MSFRRSLLTASALASALIAASPLALAQPAGGGPGPTHQTERPSPGRFIEGRVSFLKTELKITDAQAPLFDRLAAAMRADAQAMTARHERRQAAGDQPAGAVERMERHAETVRAMAERSQKFLETFKPLYAALSEDQKKTADELFHGGPMGGGRMGGGSMGGRGMMRH